MVFCPVCASWARKLVKSKNHIRGERKSALKARRRISSVDHSEVDLVELLKSSAKLADKLDVESFPIPEPIYIPSDAQKRFTPYGSWPSS